MSVESDLMRWAIGMNDIQAKVQMHQAIAHVAAAAILMASQERRSLVPRCGTAASAAGLPRGFPRWSRATERS
jgi:hypothetical protein